MNYSEAFIVRTKRGRLTSCCSEPHNHKVLGRGRSVSTSNLLRGRTLKEIRIDVDGEGKVGKVRILELCVEELATD